MTKTETQTCCGNCRFSRAAVDPQGKIDFKRRFCRWGPPTPILLPTPQGPQINNLWPTLWTTDVCGRHESTAAELVLPGENKPEAEAVQ